MEEQPNKQFQKIKKTVKKAIISAFGTDSYCGIDYMLNCYPNLFCNVCNYIRHWNNEGWQLGQCAICKFSV